MSSRYSSCFSFTLAHHPLAQHLREADDRVQRRPQLVRHVGEEVRLVLARRLELPVEAPELIAHPVHVRRERTELVAVRGVDVSEKSPEAIAASRESMRWMGRVTDHERTNPSSSARTSLLRPLR